VRESNEVKGFRDIEWAASGVSIRNPAFDVTAAGLITAMITERGVIAPVNADSVHGIFSSSNSI